MEKLKMRKMRARKMVRYLKRAYQKPKSELRYKTNFQFVVAVILSAQYTDKKVNELTKVLFRKYRTIESFAGANLKEFSDDIKSVSFFNNKAKNIIASAQMLKDQFCGRLPKTSDELQKLSGVGYKTAHVILGEVYDIWDGIAVDTHVRRFALRFDLTDNKNPDKISKDLEDLIPSKDWKYVNNGLVLYGRYICPARQHDCREHPLTKIYPNANNIWPKSK